MESKSYEHKFDKKGVCIKCHKHIKSLTYKVCPIISKEEVAGFREQIDS